MSQTVEAVMDKEGNVQLLEAIRLAEARRALVTILDDAPADEAALELGYQQMARDEERESEALEWAEATIGDVADEPPVKCGGFVSIPRSEAKFARPGQLSFK